MAMAANANPGRWSACLLLLFMVTGSIALHNPLEKPPQGWKPTGGRANEEIRPKGVRSASGFAAQGGPGPNPHTDAEYGTTVTSTYGEYYDTYLQTAALWVDISELDGTVFADRASHTDDLPYEEVHLAFTFPFYGAGRSVVFVDPNGFLSFLPIFCYSRSFCNWGWGDDTVYARYIAPMMTDFNPGAANYSKIWWRQDSEVDQDGYTLSSFTAQWDNVTLYEPASNNNSWHQPFTFQVRIESTGDIYINYKYAAFDPRTVGFSAFGQNYPVRIGIADAVMEYEGMWAWWEAYRAINFNYTYISSLHVNSIYFTPKPDCTTQYNCTSCGAFTAARLAFGNANPMQCSWCGDAVVQYCYDRTGRDAYQMDNECYNIATTAAACANLGSSRGSSASDHWTAFAIGLGSVAIVSVLAVCGWQLKKAIERRERDRGGANYVRATGEALPAPSTDSRPTTTVHRDSDAPPPSSYAPPTSTPTPTPPSGPAPHAVELSVIPS